MRIAIGGTPMKRIRVIAAVVVIACAAPVHGAAQNREHQQMAAELRILQEQNQLLSVAVQKALARLEDAVTSINTRLDASDAATRKSLADQKLIIDSLATEVRVIRERTQDSNTRIGTLTEEIEAMRGSIATLAVPTPPTAYDPFTGLPIDQQPGGGLPSAPSVSSLGISPTRLYQEAWTDYTAGLFGLAINGFETYLREFPTYEQADDAQLHIGASYMAQKQYPEAIMAFMAVIRDYPKGDKVADAYLSLGEAQRAIGQIDAARGSWETVIRMYKDSNSAIIARQWLQGLQPPPDQFPLQP
jgi:tol-pal system protein YbgF